MTIAELRQKRGRLISRMREILDAAEERDDDAQLTAEEIQEYDRIDEEQDNLRQRIEREERARDLETEIDEVPEPRSGREAPEQRGEADPGGDNPLASDEYRDAYWRQFRMTRNALDAAEIRALSVGTDSAGGYTVPQEFERTLVQGLEERNVMRGLANVIQTGSDRDIPVVSGHGSAAWTGEGSAYTESDETFDQKVLGAHKAATIMKVSEELLMDSAFDLQSYIRGEYVRRIGELEEAGFVNGDGSGKPRGLTLDAEEGKVGTSGQTTSITADDLIDLFHALARAYRRRATFLMADGTAKAVRKLKDADNQYIWQPGLQAGQPDRLLGRPVEISDDVPAMAASAKSVLFGDMNYYWIADRQGRVFQRLGELYAANGQVGFRAHQRVDGRLILTEAVKYYQNSAT